MAFFTTRLNPNKGFHPLCLTTINIPEVYQQQQCSLHLYFHLPALVFIDTNELSQRSEDYTYDHWGNTDLEKPVYALPDTRTELLITLAPTSTLSSTIKVLKTIEVSVPLHLRYGLPRKHTLDVNTKAYEHINIDWPTLFLRCLASTTQEYAGAVNVPQHVLNALDDSAAAQPCVLVPIPPHPTTERTYDTVSLPLGSKNDLAFVEPLTAITIVLCALWILRIALKTASRMASKEPKNTTPIKKDE